MKTGDGISDADARRIVELVGRDVAATIATNCHDVIVEAAARLRLVCDRDEYLGRVVEEVQQRLHDEFIDTTWPACPEHPNHPLWFDGESWCCKQSGTVVAPLGYLRPRA